MCQPSNAMEKDIDLIVWDLETTGFVAPECKILEIGSLIITGDVAEEKHWVLQNNCEIPEKITEITGITKAIIDAEGKDPKECCTEFLALLKRAKKNVTHNGVRFDIPFLTNYVADLLALTPEQKKEIVDDLELGAFDTAVHFKAKKVGRVQREGEPFIEFAKRVMDVRAFGVKFNLALCAQESNIDLTGIVAHRAMADVLVTHKIYQTLPKGNE